jgi:hypothetical protein
VPSGCRSAVPYFGGRRPPILAEFRPEVVMAGNLGVASWVKRLDICELRKNNLG